MIWYFWKNQFCKLAKKSKRTRALIVKETFSKPHISQYPAIPPPISTLYVSIPPLSLRDVGLLLRMPLISVWWKDKLFTLQISNVCTPPLLLTLVTPPFLLNNPYHRVPSICITYSLNIPPPSCSIKTLNTWKQLLSLISQQIVTKQSKTRCVWDKCSYSCVKL